MKRSWLLGRLSIMVVCFMVSGFGVNAQSASGTMRLTSGPVTLSWEQATDGWHIRKIEVGGRELRTPSGLYTVLHIDRRAAPNLVDLDLEGIAHSFYPTQAIQASDGSITFKHHFRVGDLEARWTADPAYPGDIHVTVKITATHKGGFSISTPTLAAIDGSKDLSWGMIPGNWYGREVQKDFQLATHYSQGVPAVPYLAKEKNTMTLCPLVTTRERVTLGVIPDPGVAQDPWEKDSSSRQYNKLAMSLMDRHNQLTPTAYSPVLGQKGSALQPGESASFGFRYSLRAEDWWSVFRHAVTDIYQLPAMLAIQKQYYSLSQRVQMMHTYLDDDTRSHWKTWKVNGYDIGANGQKNADVGALLMMANTGNDPAMRAHVPYVRNYKLASQDTAGGFFQGAAMGEYADEDGVGAERGNYVEPLFTTYYTLMDMGNLLLFHPNDTLLRRRVRMAADKLIAWQHPDGGYDVAYDKLSHALTFPELKDLRPTWYGLLIAYRITSDPRYLAAARKGADYLIHEAVERGYYLGVCGDARNIWDFATAQCAEGFLELYDVTKAEVYKAAAIEASKAYATSIFTHPIASHQVKYVNGQPREDWQISQAGLSVEHIRGTAMGGPILISSFAGLYTRIFQLTKDSLFLYMARVASKGRDAYVDSASGQTIYYWSAFDMVKKMVGLFPHHAYWQVGWITDYLMSEANLRSGGQVWFPYGFMTPKVGPHVSYGFAPGAVWGDSASLVMPNGLIRADNAQVEYLTALSVAKNKLYVMVLNQSVAEQNSTFTIDLGKVAPGAKWSGEKALMGSVSGVRRGAGIFSVKLPAWGMGVICVELRGGPAASVAGRAGADERAVKYVHGPNVDLVAAADAGSPAGRGAAAEAPVLEESHVRGGLPVFFGKVKAGKPVTVVYLGGSITQAGGGWREQSAAWLQQQFPAAKINAINSGVGGTGSDLGAFRTAKDVVAHKPDLVFVEFAVNDGGQTIDKIHATMEGIVRQIKRVGTGTNICFVYTLSGTMLDTLLQGRLWPSMRAMEDVAEYYHIPSVFMGKEVLKMVSAGTLVFQGKKEAHPDKMVFSPDNVHPYVETGHRLYTEALVRGLREMEGVGNAPARTGYQAVAGAGGSGSQGGTEASGETRSQGGMPAGSLAGSSQGGMGTGASRGTRSPVGSGAANVLPAPFVADNWEDATMIPLSAVAKEGEWIVGGDSVSTQFAAAFPGMIHSRQPGASFTLHIKGRLAGLYDVVGPGTGAYTVTVDGGAATPYVRFDKYATYYRSHYFLLPMLSAGYHTIEWKVSGEPIDKAGILKGLNNTIDDPAQYAPNNCYAGWLLVLGKLAPGSGGIALAPDWPFAAREEARYKVPSDTLVRAKIQQWKDLKFGLFMHWGTYSQWGIVESWTLAPEDYAFTARKGPHSGNYFEYRKAYENLLTEFNPVRFDPAKWSEAAKAAGMRYVVFTTKHHDGFCMYDTKFTDYKITSSRSPFAKDARADVTRQVFDAFRKNGFMIGAYFSKPDWHSDDFWWSYFPPKDRGPNYDIAKYPERWRRFTDFTANQIDEITTNYGAVDLMWLDGDWAKMDMGPITDKARKHQPGMIVVDRGGAPEYVNYVTPEQKIPGHYMDIPWEACLTMGNSWSYDPAERYKPVKKLVQMLVDVVAKNGNLLLDIGPSPEGEWQDTAYQRMAGIGAWMKVNGESIYETRPLAPYRLGKWAFTTKSGSGGVTGATMAGSAQGAAGPAGTVGADTRAAGAATGAAEGTSATGVAEGTSATGAAEGTSATGVAEGTRATGAAYATYLPEETEPQLPAEVRIPGGLAAKTIVLLGDGRKLKFSRVGDELVIALPASLRTRTTGQPAWVFKITR